MRNTHAEYASRFGLLMVALAVLLVVGLHWSAYWLLLMLGVFL